jgi:CxxC motif-containing protein
MEKELTCIICPIGCKVTTYHKGGLITKIEGHQCKKGLEYVKEELLDPKRTLTTTVRVSGGVIPLVSVKTDRPIQKGKLLEVMDIISEIEVDAPVNIGDILLENLAQTYVDIIATKNVGKFKG